MMVIHHFAHLTSVDERGYLKLLRVAAPARENSRDSWTLILRNLVGFWSFLLAEM